MSLLLEKPTWKEFNSVALVRDQTIKTISTNKPMILKMKQFLSDAVSNRKRNVRDELFQVLNYFGLRTAHDRRKHVPLFNKEEEISRVKKNLILKKDSGDTDFSHWRSAKIEDLTSDGSFPDILKEKNAVIDNSVHQGNGEGQDDSDSVYNRSSLGIHRNEISFHIWTQFLGYNPLEDGDKIMDISFLSITRLDAWVATFVSLVLEKEVRGGGRQRDFSRVFHANYVAATYQFVGTVFNFVKYWFPSEVTVGNIDGVGTEEEIKNVDREATILLYSPVDDTYYVAVKSTWFTEYISSNVGVVHDCFIAKVVDNWSGIVALSPDNPALQPDTQGAASNSTGTAQTGQDNIELPADNPAQQPETQGAESSSTGTAERGQNNIVDRPLTPIVYEDYDDTDDIEGGSSSQKRLAPDTVPPLPQP